MAGISGNNNRIAGISTTLGVTPLDYSSSFGGRHQRQQLPHHRIGTTLGAATAPWMILLLLEAGISGNNSAGIIDYFITLVAGITSNNTCNTSIDIMLGQYSFDYLLIGFQYQQQQQRY